MRAPKPKRRTNGIILDITEGNIDPMEPRMDAAPTPVCREVPVEAVGTAGAFGDAEVPLVAELAMVARAKTVMVSVTTKYFMI